MSMKPVSQDGVNAGKNGIALAKRTSCVSQAHPLRTFVPIS